MNVLFIGNSYTHRNEMPSILQQIADDEGKELKTSMVTAGGKTLEWHLSNEETLKVLESSKWNYVILQEQSLRPIQNREIMIQSIVKLTRLIHKTGASPILYCTWSRENTPETQTAITESYLEAAKEIEGVIASVGPAWHKALADNPELKLYTEDKSHPSILGSYLAACVFYSVMINETPVGLSHTFTIEGKPVALDPEEAELVQEAALDTVLGY